MKKKFILMFVAVSFMAVAASAEILVNGDFEDDAGTFTADVAPTGWEWELPLYFGTTYTTNVNHTIDVSAIGGGGGGTVGVYLGNYSAVDDWAWSDGFQGYFPDIGAGTYTVSITYAVTDAGIDNTLSAGLYDVYDNSDPAAVWSDGNYTTAAAQVAGVLETTVDTWHTMDIELTTTVGSNTLFINSSGYPEGNIIIGAVSMVPEPATLTLLGIGVLGLIRRKRR